MHLIFDRKIETRDIHLHVCFLCVNYYWNCLGFFSVNLLAKFMIGFTQLEKGSAYGKVITKKKAEQRRWELARRRREFNTGYHVPLLHVNLQNGLFCLVPLIYTCTKYLPIYIPQILVNALFSRVFIQEYSSNVQHQFYKCTLQIFFFLIL